MKRATNLLQLLLMALAPSVSFAQEAATTVAKTEAPGTHFGLGDDIWLGIFMSTAVVFTIIIVMINTTIRNLAETKSLWKPAKDAAAVIVLLLVSGVTFAQDATAEAAEPVFNMSDTTFWAFASANIFLMGFALVQLRLLRGITKKIAGIDEVEPAFVPEVERTPMWEKIWKKVNDHREVTEESDILLNHNYDGIRELDNNLPPWWKWGFYFTIVVGVIYLAHYHVLKTGALPAEELAITLNEAEEEVQAYLAKAAMNVDESNVLYVLADDRVAAGKSIFDANCKVCHRADLGGAVGPNLTDNYWLHGGSIKDLFKTIKYGVPAKGMKSWKADLTPIQIQNVSTYILSMVGTTPADPKEAQGDFVDPAVPEGDEPAKAEEPTEEQPEEVPAEGEDLMGAVQQ